MSRFRSIVPNDTDIDSVISDAYDAINFTTRYPDRSYEDGVIATVEWLLGECDLTPFED